MTVIDRTPKMLTTLALIALAIPAVAQLPDSPTGRRGNALIAVLLGGPEAASDEFFREQFSDSYLSEVVIAERVEWLRAILTELGPVELRGVRKTASFSATIQALSGATGERLEISYAVEEKPPHRIESLEVARTGAAPEQMSVDQMVERASEHLSRLAAAGKFSGAALVAREGQVVFEGAWGLANRRYGAANRIDTRFNLGSINKIFTKVALAQLASEGKLSFDDTVARHLPDYPDPEVAKKITVTQLVGHTSGLGDIFTDEFAAASKDRFRRPADYFALFAAEALLFEPGSGQQYSNGGYMVLGAIIEAVSGRGYHDFVRERIFEPAGMSATGAWALDDPEVPFATGYTHSGEHPGDEGPLRENTFLIPHSGTPAGGGFSTVGDLLQFRHALLDHRLLDARYTAWLGSNELADEAPPPGGLGIGIAGGGPGVNAILEISGEWTIVVMANLDPPTAGQVASWLRDQVEAVKP